MKLVSQEIGTTGPTMAIVYREERTSRPVINLFEFWLDNVEYDGHTILIVVSHHALVGIGRIRDYHSILLGCKLSWIVVLFEFLNLLLFHFFVLFTLTYSHFHPTIFNNTVGSKIAFIYFDFLFLLRDFFSSYSLLVITRRVLILLLSVLLGQAFLKGIQRLLDNRWIVFDLLEKRSREFVLLIFLLS